jgi:hypothetical protein
MQGSRGAAATAFFCAVVALGVLLFGLPRVLARWWLPPDAIGYIAAAYNWLQGVGFVDPILYSHYLPDAHPPVPALAIRPPLLSFLLVPPIAMGLGISGLHLLHVAWASLVAASALLVARRTLSVPAAAGFAIAVAWAPGWAAVSVRPLSEVTGAGALLLVLVLVRGGLASVRGALILSAATLLAWLVRPNLGIVAPAFVLAGAVELGPRRALRSRPLWAYLVSFAVLHGCAVLVPAAVFGFVPYAHYGVMAEIFDVHDIYYYGKQYVGWWAFVQANTDAILAAVQSNLGALYDQLFRTSFYLKVGWFAIPAGVVALLHSGEGSLERRFAIFAALGFALVAVATYGGFSKDRYFLYAVLCLWFATSAALDLARERIEARWGGRSTGNRALLAMVHWLPLWLVVGCFALQAAPAELGESQKQWRLYRERGTQPRNKDWDRVARSLCASIHPDAVVASPHPWAIYLWCGNAGLRIPRDLDHPGLLDRYLDEQSPGYLLSDTGPGFALLQHSPRLEAVASTRGRILYRVKDAGPRSRPWRAPPPIAALGARGE